MLIKLDIREKKLIKLIESMKEEYFSTTDVKIVVDTLDLGDIIICDKNDNELLIIERKSLNDLASSIKDGRYAEQSFRLTNIEHHNHNIVYLIEGDRGTYSTRYNRVKYSTLQSAMFSLQYFKGFSLFQTRTCVETAEYILTITKKLLKEKTRENYYKNSKNNNMLQQQNSLKTYTDVVKREKKANIKPENVGEIILSQIPGISSKTSKCVMDNFNSLYDLLDSIKNDKHCLDELVIEMKNGTNRRISQRTVKSIIKYLLYQKNEPKIVVDI